MHSTAANPGREPGASSFLSISMASWLVLLAGLAFIAVWLAPPTHAFQQLESYLPLHTFMETFAVVVAALVFGIGWNAYSAERPGNITVLACTFLAVGFLDFAHFMSYAGMPDFITPSGPEKAIDFWLSARLVAAVGLLAVALLPWRPFANAALRYGLLAASLAVIGVVYWAVLFHQDNLPPTFIPGKGLTPFKISTEYLIILIHVATIAVFLSKLRKPQPYDVPGLLASVSLMALGELCFTLYSQVTDAFNLLGHVYKVLAYALLYRTIFVDSVREPFEKLFASRQEVWREKERAQVTLESIGDAVITADAEGRIEYLNPIAEELTGWREDDARGLPLPRVFRIINEYSRNKVENPLEICLREGRVIGLANHTVLIRRDGHEYAIEDSAAPIRDRDGSIVGAVMVFHDVSERRKANEALREREEQMRTLINAMPDFVCFKDGEGRWLLANDFGLRLFEIDGLSYQDKTDAELAAASDFYREAFQACELTDEAAWRAGESVRNEESIPRRDGGEMVFDVIKVPLFHPDGRRKGLVVVGRDITERKKLEIELEQLAAVLETTPDLVAITAPEGRRMYINAAWRKLRGLSPDEDAAALSLEESYPGWALKIVREQGMPEAMEKGVWRGESAVRLQDGTEVPVSQVIFARKRPDGSVAYLATILRDISERRDFEMQLHHLAHHDPLTNLPNRTLLHDRLGQALVHARRHKRMVGVLFLDLDRFKTINDTLGHDFGDNLLRAVAERLTHCIRESDSAGRLGGDEFMIILSDLTKAQDCAVACETILREFSRPFVVGGHEFYVTCSIGVSIYPTDGEDEQVLIRNADTAMYRAKDMGRNTYQFYTADMNARAFERLALENSLRRALERDELCVYYQPRVNAVTGKITGAEALVRWRHPDMGLVPPVKFIPLAEESGLIAPIGEFVMRTACAQNKAWQEAGLPPITMAVNLSVRQFREGDLILTVGTLLKETGLDPRCLELELTESMLMQQVEAPVLVLRALKQMGIKIAIDDFGTGFSSLSYLKRFPIDYLKIDRSFVQDVIEDANDAAIVHAIIAMAHSLNLKVVAEGVEKQAQIDFLRRHECEEMQGFYFSQPVPAEEFTELLKAGGSFPVPGK